MIDTAVKLHRIALLIGAILTHFVVGVRPRDCGAKAEGESNRSDWSAWLDGIGNGAKLRDLPPTAYGLSRFDARWR
jgi:hypothetical protein